MNARTVGVINYKAGNAPSVMNALLKQDVPAVMVSNRQEMEAVHMLVLPGVGSAGATMQSLREMDLIHAMEERVNRAGVPFLGICIGLQILFTHSDEGDVDCLNWIPGHVKRFPEDKVRIPQMGWNRVDFSDGRPSAHFYFVNSYYAAPDDPRVVAATAEYGIPFCAMVRHGHIAAAQFHLEKSGSAGLKLLKELVLTDGGASC